MVCLPQVTFSYLVERTIASEGEPSDRGVGGRDGWPAGGKKLLIYCPQVQDGGKLACETKASEPARHKILLSLLVVHQIGRKSRVGNYSTCKSIRHCGGRMEVVETGLLSPNPDLTRSL